MAKKAKEEKTNVMRLLEQAKVEYKHYSYANTDAISGVEVAEVLGQNVDKVFKTLVTVGKSGEHYVFVVPVAEELDLKKAANAVGEKSIAMVKSKELLGLTGYIHGGCSPVGAVQWGTGEISVEDLLLPLLSHPLGCNIWDCPVDVKKTARNGSGQFFV